MDKIILRDIKVMATCGINPLEKMMKQPFAISATIYLDLAPAGISDDIDQTVDYSLLYEQIKKLAETSRYNLIETLAERIAGLLLQDERIKKVKVSVEKTQARRGASVFPAIAVIERERKDTGHQSADSGETP